MKALKSSFDAEGKSIEQNNKQRELLNKQIEVQKERVEAVSKMLEESKAKYGENATQTDKWRQALANAETDLNNLQHELDALPSSLELVGSKMEAIGSKISGVGSKIESFGKSMTTYVTAPVVGAFTASAKSAIDWESAFTGVMKTVDETATEEIVPPEIEVGFFFFGQLVDVSAHAHFGPRAVGDRRIADLRRSRQQIPVARRDLRVLAGGFFLFLFLFVLRLLAGLVLFFFVCHVALLPVFR